MNCMSIGQNRLYRICFFFWIANEETSRIAVQWLRRHIHNEVTRRFQDIRLDSIDVIEFLVIRRPPPPTPSDQRSNELMETDADDTVCSDSMSSDANETIEDLEPLPTITIGSESWHSNFPAPWLPIITRDISRQRRQVSNSIAHGIIRKLIQASLYNRAHNDHSVMHIYRACHRNGANWLIAQSQQLSNQITYCHKLCVRCYSHA